MNLFRRTKNNSKPLIHQIIDLIPKWILQECINDYKTDKYCHKYMTYDQLVAYLFGQLCKCSTLEDISVGIGVSETFIKDLGLKQSPAKSTMCDGNKKRDYRVFEQIFYRLMKHYGNSMKRHNGRQVIQEIEQMTIKIRDGSTISLCLSMFD